MNTDRVRTLENAHKKSMHPETRRDARTEVDDIAMSKAPRKVRRAAARAGIRMHRLAVRIGDIGGAR